MGDFDRAYKLVGEYHDLNATHRKGYRLRDMSRLDILKSAAGELLELGDTRPLSEEESDELGDVFAVLLHLAYASGFTLDQIGAAILDKLPRRFSVPA